MKEDFRLVTSINLSRLSKYAHKQTVFQLNLTPLCFQQVARAMNRLNNVLKDVRAL